MRERGTAASGDGRYLAAARAFAPLARDEEHALALRARAGDGRARQALVNHHLALVASIVRRHYRGKAPFEDLMQEGIVGLLRAAERFDPHAGVRFMTYATWWIRAYAGKYSREAPSTVRPRTGAVAPRDVSLDVPVGAADEDPWLERLEDDAPGPEERSAAAESRARVGEALRRVHRRLGPIARDIARRRLQHPSPATLQEIADRWGLSRERVRQIEVRMKELLHRDLAQAFTVPEQGGRRSGGRALARVAAP